MPTSSHEITTRLTAEQTEQRLNSLLGQPVAPLSAAGAELYHPLSEAADEYIHFSRTPDARIYTGLEEFDGAMRGIAPDEFALIVAYAHAGKTVLASHIVLNNAQKRVAWFTPDETRVLLLVKLASLIHGVTAEEYERRIAQGDASAADELRQVATDHLPNLAVFDQPMTLDGMNRAVDEAVDNLWGAEPDLVVFDYVDLLRHGDNVVAKIDALKAWGKERHVAMLVLHQSSRSAGKDGQVVTMSSGGYGGEQQATFLLGVRRKAHELESKLREKREALASAQTQAKRDPLAYEVQELEYELSVHADTITLALVKCKRPPSRLVPDTDYRLDPQTARLTPFVQRDVWQQAEAF